MAWVTVLFVILLKNNITVINVMYCTQYFMHRYFHVVILNTGDTNLLE